MSLTFTAINAIPAKKTRRRLVNGGRLQLPSDVRRAFDLVDGDQVVMQVVDGELHIRPARDVLKRIQTVLRPYAPDEGSVSEELIAECG